MTVKEKFNFCHAEFSTSSILTLMALYLRASRDRTFNQGRQSAARTTMNFGEASGMRSALGRIARFHLFFRVIFCRADRVFDFLCFWPFYWFDLYILSLLGICKSFHRYTLS